MKRCPKWISIILRGIGVLALCAGILLAVKGLSKSVPAEEAEIIFAGTLEDADCAILISRDSCIVIDTGEEQDGMHIAELLEEKGVSTIDCLILTHPDKDHIGGAAHLLDVFSVKSVIVPYYTHNNSRYDNLQYLLEEKEVAVITPARSREFVYGELTIRIWPPEEFYYDKDNNYSLATLVRHGENRMFFAGDAQKQRMLEILTYPLGEVDLYKVSYHGRNLTTGARLILQLQPKYAVVTAAAPEPEIAQALEAVEAEVFCTLKKDVRFLSNGTEIKVITE